MSLESSTLGRCYALFTVFSKNPNTGTGTDTDTELFIRGVPCACSLVSFLFLLLYRFFLVMLTLYMRGPDLRYSERHRFDV